MIGKKTLLTLGFTAALCVGAIVDLAPYQAAIDALPQDRVDAIVKKQVEDMDRLEVCDELRAPSGVTKEENSRAELRSCLVDALNTIQTATAALKGSSMASVWLSENVEDEEVRVATLNAIEKARATLIEEKWYYEGLQRVYDAHDGSVILLIKNGPQAGEGMFLKIGGMLDMYEFRVKGSSGPA